MFGPHALSCYDNKSQPKAEWWERKLGQVLTGNSSVWWVNIESAKSHLGHHLTSSAQRRSVLTVNKDILPTFRGVNTGLWKQTAARPPHLPPITAPCERTLRYVGLVYKGCVRRFDTPPPGRPPRWVGNFRSSGATLYVCCEEGERMQRNVRLSYVLSATDVGLLFF